MRAPQPVGQHVAVEDAQRTALGIDHWDGQQIGFAIKATQYVFEPGGGQQGRDRAQQTECRLFDAAMHGVQRLARRPGLDELTDFGAEGDKRLRCRARKGPALRHAHPGGEKGLQIAQLLDAFGDHPRLAGLGHHQHRAHESGLQRIVGHAIDEFAVDLEITRTQPLPQPHAAEALAEVVQRQCKAQVVQQTGFVERASIDLQIVHFEHFEHDARRLQTQALNQLQRLRLREPALVEQRLGNVEKQQPGQLGAAECLQRAAHAVLVEFGQPTLAARRIEQGGRTVQRRAFRSAHQGFEAVHGAAAQIHNGLKHHLQGVFAQDAVEQDRRVIRQRREGVGHGSWRHPVIGPRERCFMSVT